MENQGGKWGPNGVQLRSVQEIDGGKEETETETRKYRHATLWSTIIGNNAGSLTRLRSNVE